MGNFLSAIFKTGSSSAAALFLGMASVKIMAMVLGPSGVGLFSLIRQTMVTMAAMGLGGQTALVQGIASKQGGEREIYIRTTFWIFFCGSVLTIVLIEILAPSIASWLFGKRDAQSTDLIRWIALPVILSNIYIYLKSMLNGFRAIGRLALVEILGPVVITILVYPVCLSVGRGYALAFIWMICGSQLAMIVSSLVVLYRNGWLSPFFGSAKIQIDKAALEYFFKIAGITFVTAVLGTVSILIVRALVVRHGGLQEAGFFDLAWALSGNYVMLLLGAVGTYYMPVLSATAELSERLVLIRQVNRLSILLFVPMIVCVIALKPLVVSILYSSEFTPSLKVIRWMLIGDYLKITSWLLAIPALAKADMKIYLWAEIFWFVGFVTLSTLSIVSFGKFEGIAIAFAGLYAVLVLYYLRYLCVEYGMRLTADVVVPWTLGLSMVVLVSWQTWDVVVVEWGVSALWIFMSFVFVSIMMNKSERDKVFHRVWQRRSR